MLIAILHHDWLERIIEECGSAPTRHYNMKHIINNLSEFTIDSDGDLVLRHDDYKHLIPPQQWINDHANTAYIDEVAINKFIDTKDK